MISNKGLSQKQRKCWETVFLPEKEKRAKPLFYRQIVYNEKNGGGFPYE